MVPQTEEHKLASRWATAIWLGVREESGEIIVGTNEGVIKVRTVRRKGSEEERWNIVQLNDMKGSPWEPQPGVDSSDIYIRKLKLER